ncbi:MAG: DUF4199 domain-containing protein [Vicingaceae bacterium]
MYFKIAGYMTLAAVAAKLLLFLIGLPQQEMAIYTMFINLLVILVGSFFTVRGYRLATPGSTLKSEFKAGMRSVAIFSLLLSVFVLVYYNYIDTHYFEFMIDDRMALAEKELINNPDINLEQVRKTGEMLFTPRVHATITLFGLTAAGAVYTLLLVVLTRKVLKLR